MITILEAVVVVVIILALTVLAVLKDVPGSVAAPIFTAAVGGILGYGRGRRP